jgi:hypothetical protein
MLSLLLYTSPLSLSNLVVEFDARALSPYSKGSAGVLCSVVLLLLETKRFHFWTGPLLSASLHRDCVRAVLAAGFLLYTHTFISNLSAFEICGDRRADVDGLLTRSLTSPTFKPKSPWKLHFNPMFGAFFDVILIRTTCSAC